MPDELKTIYRETKDDPGVSRTAREDLLLAMFSVANDNRVEHMKQFIRAMPNTVQHQALAKRIEALI